MKRWTIFCLLVVGLSFNLGAAAQQETRKSAEKAGTQTIGVSVTEVRLVAKGWSVKKTLLGKEVYYGREIIGHIADLIVAPDTFVSYAIVGVGGFLGIGTHDVAIPVGQFEITPGGNIVLPGATREKLEAMPKFEYAK